MNRRLLPLTLTLLTMLVVSTLSARSQAVVTFDDLSETGTGSLIPNGYQGLSWSNVVGLNGFLYAGQVPFYTNGYYYGVVSGSNVVYNHSGSPAEIDSQGTNFNFLGAYFTGAWDSNLNIEAQGYRGANLVYDETKVVGGTSPTPLTFDYLDIDRLDLIASGGEPAFINSISGTYFVMDNFMFEFIPEPSTFLLAALGAVSLGAFLRRKR